MGYRYRKSINLGGGFRINISKSGVGYSWGTKGYRVTKTAKGTIRQTVSIPGSGISHVQEFSGAKHPPRPKKQTIEDSNYYDAQQIVNGDASAMVSDGLGDILDAANRTMHVNRISTICMIIFFFLSFFALPFIFLFLLSIALKIYAKTAGKVDLEYVIDTDQEELVEQRMRTMLRLLECNKLWRITQSKKVIDRKYTGGADTTINRVACIGSKKPPYPFRSNVPVASFRSGRETLVFLPDKLFLIQKNKIGALNYSDISTSAHTTRFLESGPIPKDAEIVGRTWQYVNKSGGPDKRFKNNRQIPICLYGELELTSSTGLNTIIMFSNPKLS